MSSSEMAPLAVPVGLEIDLLLRMDDDDDENLKEFPESSLLLGELDRASGMLFMSLEVGSSNA